MTTLTNRTFGIEIEAKGLDHNTVEAVLSAEGISVYRTNYMNHTAETTKWKVKPDGSLSGLSFEVVSPVLQGEEGIEQVRTVLKALEGAGATVARESRVHVHWGVGNWGIKQFKNLYKQYAKYEQAIDSFLAPSRRANNSRWANGYSVSAISHATITDFFAKIDASRNLQDLRRAVASTSTQYARYRKLNMEAFWVHSTIEFRQHQGTLNADKAEHWIRLTGAMIAQADALVTQRNWGLHTDGRYADDAYPTKYKLDYMFERMLRNGVISSKTTRFLKKRARDFGLA